MLKYHCCPKCKSPVLIDGETAICPCKWSGSIGDTELIPEDVLLDGFRAMVWEKTITYHRKTGIPIEELFGEAQLIAVMSLRDFVPSKPWTLSCWLWKRLDFFLLNYIHSSYRGRRYPKPMAGEQDFSDMAEALPTDQEVSPDRQVAFKETLEGLSEDAKRVVSIVLTRASTLPPNPTKARKMISDILKHSRTEKWTGYRVNKAFSEIRTALATLN